jgi:multimeric flavodoxin WrbA
MIDADGIILASPTYFANVSSEMKALIDRAGLVSRQRPVPPQNRGGGGGGAAAGRVRSSTPLTPFFLMSQMIVPGSVYWNMDSGWNAAMSAG